MAQPPTDNDNKVYDPEPADDESPASMGISPEAKMRRSAKARAAREREDFNPEAQARKAQGAQERAGATQEATPADDNEAQAHDGEDASDQAGAGYTPDPQLRQAVKLKMWRRSTVVLALLFGTGFGGGVGTFFLIKGPLQLLHLGSVLDRFSGHSNRAIKSRNSGFFRTARALRRGDIAETHVGYFGSRRFHNIETQLGEVGVSLDRIDPRTGRTTLDGRPRGLDVDAGTHPELSQLPLNEKAAAIGERYRIPAEKVHQVSGLNGGKFRIQLRDLNVGELRDIVRALVDTDLRNFSDGRVGTAMNKRVMMKYFDLPSLFHPIKRLGANLDIRWRLRVERRAFETERRTGKQGRFNPKYERARARVRSAIAPHATAINNALLFTALACLAREIHDEIPLVNYINTVLPSIIRAVDIEAVKAQMQSGDGLSGDGLMQLQAVSESLVDKDGDTVWGSQPLTSLANGGPGTGTDIADTQKQAFTNEATSYNILSTVTDNGATELACSPVGVVIQAVASIGLLVIGPGGWAAKTAQASVSTVATMAAMIAMKEVALDLLTSEPVESFAGPAGGSLMAYGARAGQGLVDRKMGGVPLQGTNNRVTLEEVEIEEREEFQRKNFFARMFDVRDYRSLASTTVRSSDTNPAQAVSSLATSLTDGGNLISKIFSAFSPKAYAQDESYDWGSPIYGIPSRILDDPDYEDPYENAEIVGEMLDASEGESLGANTNGPQVLDHHTIGDQVRTYRERAETCFGVEFFKDAHGWSVAPNEEVNPAEDDYVDANCGDMSNQSWVRFVLFIFDTSIITAEECFSGNQEACNLMIYGREEGQAGPAPTTPLGPDDCPTASVTDQNQLITLEGTTVHRCIADQFGRMVADARAAGHDLTGGGGWRDPQTQIELRRRNCGTSHYAIYEMPASQCSPDTARPGTSMHERGLAIDFPNMCYPNATCPGDPRWVWLTAHATEFGFHPLDSEAWHWSVNGN